MTETDELALPAVDQECAAAIELARASLICEVTEANVGDHLEVIAEDDRVATHLFACADRAYVGWRWAVTVARAPESDKITINEVALLPGPDSLLAPAWLPWGHRVQSGDLGVGDVLPTAPDDPRLVPGYADIDATDESDEDALGRPDDEVTPVAWELGHGRPRVLSALGRDLAAERWESGDGGPKSAIARAATEQCSSCGFLVAVSGPLGQAFGVCANEYSPADGRVVALNHGCGAHSEAETEPPPIVVVDLVVDDLSTDKLDLSLDAAELAAEAEAVELAAQAERDEPPAEAEATSEATADTTNETPDTEPGNDTEAVVEQPSGEAEATEAQPADEATSQDPEQAVTDQ
ncbi:MAG: DUF3027 domain-containing protein [Actinomycetes bacterium]